MDITLLHYICESDNQNIILFDNATQRDTYFAGISDKITIQNINFFANDIMQTKAYVRVDNLSLFHLLNYNYAIVTNSTGETTQKPLFFHIKNSRQDSGGQIELSLECDIANTYFYDLDFEKMQGIIERSHLDRVFKNSNSEYIFDFRKTTKLFEREKIKNVSKRVVKKLPLYPIVDKRGDYTQSVLNKWLKDNVICYKYYFLDATTEYKYHRYNGTGTEQHILASMKYQKKYDNESYMLEDSNFVVICEPVYKSGGGTTTKKIYFRTSTDDFVIGGTTSLAMQEFLSVNNLYAHIKAIKYSPMPPFKTSTFNTNTYEIINNNLYIKDYYGFFQFTLLDDIDLISGPTDTNGYVMHIGYQYLDNINFYIDDELEQLDEKWNYTKNEILANSEIEPKLKNEDYSTYKLLIGGQQQDLPISKTSNLPRFIYKEILAPDITKGILIYNPTNSNDNIPTSEQVFTEYTKSDFTGFIFTIDLSLWFIQDRLNDYLASNKNFAQIFQNNFNRDVQNFTIDAITSATNFDTPKGNFTTFGTNILQQSAKMSIDASVNIENNMLTLDNMANAPKNTSSINSNAMLITYENDIKFYIEKLEMLPFEKQTMIDYFKQFGYTYNRLSNIADVMRTRKYYNYVQANIFEIEDKIGNNVKEKIKQMFANGIRFWHYDNFDGIDFTKNNYERFLDNE